MSKLDKAFELLNSINMDCATGNLSVKDYHKFLEGLNLTFPHYVKIKINEKYRKIQEAE